MTNFNWTCPFCNHAVTIVDERILEKSVIFDIDNADGPQLLNATFIVCPNHECRKLTLTVELNYAHLIIPAATYEPVKLRKRWRLLPESYAKVFPSYVPEAIREDYGEACAIRDHSPKAAATLARRCLQGTIRDYWGISKARLKDEIEAIQDKVDATTWKAIDAVRSIGNIGAHMEKDIDVIINVKPEEAEALIDLIETLIEDWYIARHDREEHLKGIVAIKEQKEAQKGQTEGQDQG